MINLIEKLSKNKSIVVCKQELRIFFLALKAKSPELNFKLYTLSSLEKEVFGTVNEEALKIGFAKFKNFSLASKFLSYIKQGVDTKIDDRIDDFYNDLLEQKLIYKDEKITFLFKDKIVYFVGFDEENGEIRHIIDVLGLTNHEFVPLSSIFAKKDFNVTSFLRADEAIKETFTRINALLEEGCDSRNIMILTDIESNRFYLELYANLFRINLYFDENLTLFDTKIAKQIETNLADINESNFDQYDDGSDYFKQIKDVLSYYDFFKYSDSKYDNYKHILMTVGIKKDVEERGIYVTNSFDYIEGKTIFLVGFDNSFYLKVSKNNDYLDNDIKREAHLITTEVSNKEDDEVLHNFLNLDNDLNLYFYENGNDTKQEMSFYLAKRYSDKKERNKHIVRYKDQSSNVEYSEELAKNYYSYYEDLKTRYKEDSIEYRRYNNYFGDIKNEKYSRDFTPLKDDIEVKQLSYTKMNSFMECPFKYFCDSVLKLGSFETNFNLKVGNFVHEIFEHVYKDLKKYLSSAGFLSKKEELFKDLTDLENLFLEKIMVNVMTICERLIKEKDNSYIYKTDAEKVFKIDIHGVNFTGKVDSILYADDGEYKAIQIIDYKSSKTKIDKNKQAYFLNLQLPIYQYFVNNDKDLKNFDIQGIYYLNFMDKTLFNFDDQVEYKKNAEENFIRTGKYSSSLDLLNLFEKGVTTTKNIKTIKGKEKNGFVNGGSIFSSADNNALIEKAVDTFKTYLNNKDFPISPFFKDEKDSYSACRYCEFEDICFNLENKTKRIQKSLYKEIEEEKGINE